MLIIIKQAYRFRPTHVLRVENPGFLPRFSLRESIMAAKIEAGGKKGRLEIAKKMKMEKDLIGVKIPDFRYVKPE